MEVFISFREWFRWQLFDCEVKICQGFFVLILFIWLIQNYRQLFGHLSTFSIHSIKFRNVFLKLLLNFSKIGFLKFKKRFTYLAIFSSWVLTCFSLVMSPFSLKIWSCLKKASTMGQSFARDFLKFCRMFLSDSIFLYSSP